MFRLLSIVTLSVAACTVVAWVPTPQLSLSSRRSLVSSSSGSGSSTSRFSLETKDKQVEETEEDVAATTEKFGLEAGLFQSLKKEDGGESAKSLLKKYGIAYLATSIPLALVSFSLCYFLVDSGVDVAALLAKVGIDNAASEKAGTFAIAYAAQ
jgi:hypothetical protein